jgi:hypothetical protein
MAISTSYDRPIKADLVVQLDSGESWRATEDDLEKFHLIRTTEAYQSLMYSLEGAITRSRRPFEHQAETMKFIAAVLLPSTTNINDRNDNIKAAADAFVTSVQNKIDQTSTSEVSNT